MLFREYSGVGISCLFMTGLLGNSLVFPVRCQNMCLVGTLTIRGLLSSLVSSFVRTFLHHRNLKSLLVAGNWGLEA